ncbi:RICIN domain-containing protein [Streptosporangium jomthongense]|uniref:RICIN domain-containing protein n=1 Tax=Streptosporangium jomthongense TaxID=1193683 RepID=A0ABV8F950_9ACTN
MNHPTQRLSSRRLAAATVLAAALTGTAMLAPHAAVALDAPAQQTTMSDAQTHTIKTFSDKCFTVANTDPGNSVPIRTYTCRSNDPSQQFTLVPVGNNEYEIKTFSDKCFTVANSDPGNSVPIRTYTCRGDFSQRFRLVPAGNNEYEIRAFSDKCFTIANGDPGNSAPIRTYTCSGDFSQRFRFDPGL